jgi:cytochrome c oxidase subunit II
VFRFRLRSLLSLQTRFLLFSALVFFAGCSPIDLGPETNRPLSALEPRGPFAANIAELWWVMFVLGTGVFILVTALTLYILFLRNPQRTAAEVNRQRGMAWIIYGGVVMPVIVLAVVYVFTLRSFDFIRQVPNPPVVIEAVGHMWWWEFRYPEQDFITANEMHIPVGQHVEVRLTSADVIHSFWVPELHGKLDMIPGQVQTLQIIADEPGIYRGICGEFCGLQHARMHFMVIAQPEEEYEEWLVRQQQPAPAPEEDNVVRGQQVFFEVGCHFCHAIQGTQANRRFGPDLTHLASRHTIAAGVLPNNRGSLGGWVVNPQTVKPGVRMPPAEIGSEDLQALLDYLETLR